MSENIKDSLTENVLKEFDVEFGKLYDIEQLKSIEELNKKNGTDFVAYPRNERLKSFICSVLKKQREYYEEQIKILTEETK